MLVNAKKHTWSLILRGPIKVLSTIFMFIVIAAMVVKAKDILLANFETVGLASLLLVILSFLSGYLIARIFVDSKAQVRTITFEVGLQNGTLALLITASIIKIPAMALASIFYGLLMFVAGFVVILLFNKTDNKKPSATP